MTIEINNLSFHYRKGKVIFQDISFTVQRNEIIAVLGANGTGKTTLLNCIANLSAPSNGAIQINGTPLKNLSKNDYAKTVAYVPQFHSPVFPYSVLDFVTMGRAPYIGVYGTPRTKDIEIARQNINLLNINHLADRSYMEISGGERQLVMIAQALTQEPEYLILDEPTSHLDFGNQIRTLTIIEKLSQNGFGILLTSHYPDHSLMFNHKVAVMHNHSFIAFDEAKIAISKENMERIYGLSVEIYPIPAPLDRRVCLPVN